MDEVRRNNAVKIELSNDRTVNGVVLDYISDRIMISISQDDALSARELKELDDVKITIYTPLGIKTMNSHVISPVNHKNCMVVENVPTAEIAQRREFVRIEDDFEFDVISTSQGKVHCKCINISAGGLAFRTDKKTLQKDELLTVILGAKLFERDIMCKAQVLNTGANDRYTARFIDLKSYDEDKIVKYVFKIMTRTVD